LPELPRVPRAWPGATVVCIAGGPSLTAEDVATVRGRARVIAVNDAYRLAPWADVLYACDAKWWGWHKGVKSFTGPKYALERSAAKWQGVQVLRHTGTTGLEDDPGALRTGKNSGYQAINLAVHFGAARILLLGYDMQTGPKGEEHWFGHHPNMARSPLAVFRRHYDSLVEPLRARGIEVLNCSRSTALDAFPVVPLEEALAHVAPAAEVLSC
jgi:hypothetical protein